MIVLKPGMPKLVTWAVTGMANFLVFGEWIAYRFSPDTFHILESERDGIRLLVLWGIGALCGAAVGILYHKKGTEHQVTNVRARLIMFVLEYPIIIILNAIWILFLKYLGAF